MRNRLLGVCLSFVVFTAGCPAVAAATSATVVTVRTSPQNMAPATRGAYQLNRAGATVIEATAISAGDLHTCALTPTGGVKCWGWNEHGQLGGGSWSKVWTIVDVYGLDRGVQAIASGGSHTCALTDGGAVKCWGDNRESQLGDGSTVDRWAPVDVEGLSAGVQAIAAGESHTCALTAAGGVKCWGSNSHGQLGAGTPVKQGALVNVVGLDHGVQAIAAGGDHTCAITDGAGVKCWGNNEAGQVVDGADRDYLSPVDVVGLASGVRTITAGGAHTCASTVTGDVKCWGANGSGQLGAGTWFKGWKLVDVEGLTGDVEFVSAGQSHTCTLSQAGGIACWGENERGQLSDGTTIDRFAAVSINSLGGAATSLTTGSNHSCAILSDASVQCWGDDSRGQLGDGAQHDWYGPVTIGATGSADFGAAIFLPAIGH